MTFYLRKRFPEITTEKWYTRLKHNLISGKILGHLAAEEGFEKFIRYGDDMKELKEHPELDKNNSYEKMLENVMEAFFGCIVIVIETRLKKSHGTAIQICHFILRSFFDHIEISTRYEDVFDAVTRLKELYRAERRGLLWPSGEVQLHKDGNIRKEGTYKFEVDVSGPVPVYSATVYGWPLGDRKAIPQNRVMLSSGTGINKKDLKQKVAAEALKVLETTYGIEDLPPIPYQKKF